MHGLVDPVYEAVDGRSPNDIRRGDIYEDQPVYLPARHALRLSKIDPKETRQPEFEIAGRTHDAFLHQPIKWPVELPHGEALIVSRAKWSRPVIVISDAAGSELIAGLGSSRVVTTRVCIPIYGCDQHDRTTMQRVERYEFPNLFYLPKSVRPHMDEGFARLDHLQAIESSSLRNRRCQLSSDALDFLDEWLAGYLTGRMPSSGLIALYLSSIEDAP